MYFCPGAKPRAAPRAEGVDRQVPAASSTRATRRYRELVFERQKQIGIFPEDAELTPLNPYADGDQRRRQAVAPGRRRAPLGLALRRREDALLPHGRGLRRLLQSHRPPGRAAPRVPRGDRPARQHDHRASCPTTARRGEGGPNGSVNENKFFNGFPDTFEENLQYLDVLGSPGDLQPLSNRVGLGLQHAVQDVQAVQLRRRRRRSAGRLVAEGHQGATGEVRHQYQPRHRHRPDHLRLPRRRDAGGRQGLHAVPARGRQLPLHASRATKCRRRRSAASSRCSGPRAIWHKGGKRSAVHPTIAGLGPLRRATVGSSTTSTKIRSESRDLA